MKLWWHGTRPKPKPARDTGRESRLSVSIVDTPANATPLTTSRPTINSYSLLVTLMVSIVSIPYYK